MLFGWLLVGNTVSSSNLSSIFRNFQLEPNKEDLLSNLLVEHYPFRVRRNTSCHDVAVHGASITVRDQSQLLYKMLSRPGPLPVTACDIEIHGAAYVSLRWNNCGPRPSVAPRSYGTHRLIFRKVVSAIFCSASTPADTVSSSGSRHFPVSRPGRRAAQGRDVFLAIRSGVMLWPISGNRSRYLHVVYVFTIEFIRFQMNSPDFVVYVPRLLVPSDRHVRYNTLILCSFASRSNRTTVFFVSFSMRSLPRPERSGRRRTGTRNWNFLVPGVWFPQNSLMFWIRAEFISGHETTQYCYWYCW